MATQILGTDHPVLLPRSTDVGTGAYSDTAGGLPEEEGSVIRGFFFAMLFDLLLLLMGAVAWRLWRLIP